MTESFKERPWTSVERHSRRLTALGFILLILIGNIWFALGLSGANVPNFLQLGAALGLGLVVVGGLGQGISAFMAAISPNISLRS